MNRRNLLAVLAALPTALLARVKAHTRRPLYVTKIDPVERSVTFDTEPFSGQYPALPVPRHHVYVKCDRCEQAYCTTNYDVWACPRCGQ